MLIILKYLFIGGDRKMLNTGTAMQDQLNYVHIHLGPLFPSSMKPFNCQNDKAKSASIGL